MPTPLEILLDPISLGAILIYLVLILMEAVMPARDLPKVKGWYVRTLVSFIVYFYLSSYLPLFWDQFLSQYQLMDLTGYSIWFSLIVSLLVFEGMLYAWHRSMHKNNILWRVFHQMHHSAERLDTYGAFYFGPLDMIGFTLLGSLSLVVVVGVNPTVATYFLFITMFLGVFQHTNIKTPRWLGYFIQRPESHSLHHAKGVHAYNYSDLPLFDIIFGTFKNPKNFAAESGFYPGASGRIPDMLMFRDITVGSDENISSQSAGFPR